MDSYLNTLLKRGREKKEHCYEDLFCFTLTIPRIDSDRVYLAPAAERTARVPKTSKTDC